MNGAAIMNFTLKRVPPLISDTLGAAGMGPGDVDYFVLHQSNRFIMKHLARKCNVPDDKMPMTLWEHGNTGGPSVPLTIAQGKLVRPGERALRLLLLAYGVGLSWGSALVDLPMDAVLDHIVLDQRQTVENICHSKFSA